jgi:hypothetical protein
MTILCIGATLIVVSTVIKANIKEDSEGSVALELWARACSGIGEALAIAAVIAYLVDEAAKRRLLTEFAQDVSQHIIGRLLPSGLRERMLQYLTVDFVRSNWTVIYELKVRHQQTNAGTFEKHVELMTESSYSMENRSPLDKTYIVAYEVMKKWFENLRAPEIKSVLVNGNPVNGCRLKDGGTGVFVRLNPEDAPDLVVPMRGHGEKETPHKVDVRLKLAEYLGATFYTSFDALHPEEMQKSPLDPALLPEYQELLIVTIQAPDFTVEINSASAPWMDDKPDYKYGAELLALDMMAMTSYVLQNPETGKNGFVHGRAGLTATLRGYEAILKQEPSAQSRSMEAALAAEKEGKLDDWYKERYAAKSSKKN